MNERSQQHGGIVSFLIVGVALAVLLSGGLYFSKHQARLARDGDTEAPVAVDTKPDEQKVPDEATQPGNSTTTDETEDPAMTPATEEPVESTGRTSSISTTGPSQVAASGPTETIAVTVALASLTYATYAVLASRKKLHVRALSQ